MTAADGGSTPGRAVFRAPTAAFCGGFQATRGSDKSGRSKNVEPRYAGARVAKQSDKSAGGEDRVFIKDGFRAFRRTYRVREVYWGAGTGALLIGIVGWVGWKGAHPDPSLFDMSAALVGNAPAEGAAEVDAVERRAAERLGAPRPRSEPGEHPGGAGAADGNRASAADVPADRGPLPAGLANGLYREGKLGAYDADNLYIKINGRAGYFQAFGVKTLHTLTLEGGPESAPASVDIEAYDLAESRNAIGAYNGERPPGIESVSEDGSTYHFDRNAGFLARGRFYVRFIGSDESPAVVSEVRRLLDLFRQQLVGEALPWGFALFVDQLKLSPSAVTYVKSNAFSFGFARDVFKASLSPADSKEDMEAFVVAAADAAAARALAARYAEGFASLGKAAGQTPANVALFEDEFLATFSAASVVERWVIGVRGAPNAGRAAEVLAQLERGIAALPAEVRARALPSAETDEPADEYAGAGSAEPVPPPADAPPAVSEGQPGSSQEAPGNSAEKGTEDEY
jgi:hypothetical protein